MTNIYFYSYVEDEPSKEIAKKLFAIVNNKRNAKLHFREGFPKIEGGYGLIKKKAPSFIEMAINSNLYTFSITDLDRRDCAVNLIRDWFNLGGSGSVSLPKEVIFRIAVREIESWVMADRKEWGKYIGIGENNFSLAPDDLPDPKGFLLKVVNRKGSSRIKREMLPIGSQHIGSGYNGILCKFISSKWSPIRAAKFSPSLERTVKKLIEL